MEELEQLFDKLETCNRIKQGHLSDIGDDILNEIVPMLENKTDGNYMIDTKYGNYEVSICRGILVEVLTEEESNDSKLLRNSIQEMCNRLKDVDIFDPKYDKVIVGESARRVHEQMKDMIH